MDVSEDLPEVLMNFSDTNLQNAAVVEKDLEGVLKRSIKHIDF